MSTEELPPRESMEFDVVIVGAGPSGLAAAIRLKQINADLNVVVVEKGSEVGAHILSGAVIDPAGLDKLIPDWREDSDCPLKTQVKDDRFFWFTETSAIKLPNFIMPPLMDNHHCYIGSLGNVCRWLARKAEALGVEIYPGFAAAEVLYDDNGAVRGIATGDMGIGRDGKPKDSFTRGMELLGKYTLFAEGARGSLTKQLISKYALDTKSEPPKFGIGLKEVWQIDPAKHQKGLVQHAVGWPLNNNTGGAACSSTIMTRTWCRSVSSFISTTTTPICRHSTNSSASRTIRPSARRLKAASGWLTARAPSPKAGTSRCRG
ncbi:flavin-dependent dehydrogenase [Bradyrhizobium sp. GM6.1]